MKSVPALMRRAFRLVVQFGAGDSSRFGAARRTFVVTELGNYFCTFLER